MFEMGSSVIILLGPDGFRLDEDVLRVSEEAPLRSACSPAASSQRAPLVLRMGELLAMLLRD